MKQKKPCMLLIRQLQGFLQRGSAPEGKISKLILQPGLYILLTNLFSDRLGFITGH